MPYDIEREIARFERWGGCRFAAHRVERLCEYGWLLQPAAASAPDRAGKDIALTLMGITHGNEWAGAAVLNEVLAHLAAGTVGSKQSLAFILGNPWAARENRRFLERDRTRSFARPPEAAPSREGRRAADLEAALRRTAFSLDLHQTTRVSERPFFIFPHTPAAFAWARRIAPQLTVVTHWGRPFSAEGRCSDEFVNAAGGCGLSLELGQNGFDPYQIGVGIDAVLRALRSVETASGGETAAADAGESLGEIFTWAEIVPWPASGVVELRPDWHNFKPVAAGEVLGTVDGRPLRAAAAGRMLFPKYLSPAEQSALVSRPTELCRIMKPVQTKELPA
jgi:succinylglutamate desuccinylase